MFPLDNKQEDREDYGMTRTREPHSLLKKAEGAIEHLARRLQCWSYDLTNTLHLRLRFQGVGDRFSAGLSAAHKIGILLPYPCKGECSLWITYR